MTFSWSSILRSTLQFFRCCWRYNNNEMFALVCCHNIWKDHLLYVGAWSAVLCFLWSAYSIRQHLQQKNQDHSLLNLPKDIFETIHELVLVGSGSILQNELTRETPLCEEIYILRIIWQVKETRQEHLKTNKILVPVVDSSFYVENYGKLATHAKILYFFMKLSSCVCTPAWIVKFLFAPINNEKLQNLSALCAGFDQLRSSFLGGGVLFYWWGVHSFPSIVLKSAIILRGKF